ncbi:MAG: hypothetical protein OJF49_001477 [Ktedonobacterales bacterium]|jgi:hypothetical protein|nr:MAG: hypothetical protein OJF49_001477 [Ktedonobacterales bacterium]
MTTPGNPGDGQGGSALGGVAGAFAKEAIAAALPPEVQDLLKPGKTPDRIQRAISWAAQLDPSVMAAHRSHGHAVKTFQDIRALNLKDMDHVARHFARKYRHRAALTGAVTGLPGGLWAVVAAGADVQLTAIYAVRMVSDIAQSYGYDTGLIDEQTHLAEVLALAAGIDSLRGIGNMLAREGLSRLLPEVLPRLLMRLSLKLTEEQAAKWIGRIIPGVGAAVGGAIDYTFLRAAGERAMAYYHNRYLIEHGLPADNSKLSAASRVFTALAEPGAPAQLPMPGQQPNIVEGSIVAPGSHQLPAPQVGVPHPATPGEVLQRIPAPHPKHKAPERFGIYLAIFAVFALFATIAACAALYLILADVVNSLHLTGMLAGLPLLLR